MRKTNWIMLGSTSLGLLGACVVFAQETPTQQIVDEIRVEAPRMVASERLPAGRGQQVALAYNVSFADLDLRQTAAVHELENRIATAANEICAQLEAMYPVGTPSKEVCARRATDEAMADARAVIDAVVAR